MLDPTCGSGWTAYVSEHWGRRWITIDTSRVPIALARQRILTATFPWFALRDETRGPVSGFIYERQQNRKGEEIGGIVPHTKLDPHSPDEAGILSTFETVFGLEFSILLMANRGGDGGPDG